MEFRPSADGRWEGFQVAGQVTIGGIPVGTISRVDPNGPLDSYAKSLTYTALRTLLSADGKLYTASLTLGKLVQLYRDSLFAVLWMSEDGGFSFSTWCHGEVILAGSTKGTGPDYLSILNLAPPPDHPLNQMGNSRPGLIGPKNPSWSHTLSNL